MFNTFTGRTEALYNINLEDGTKVNFNDLKYEEEVSRFGKKTPLKKKLQ